MINQRRNTAPVRLADFKMMMVLGRGTFGKVYLAELNLNKQVYAIKSIRKDVLIDTDQVENTKLEKDIMFTCDHPFLITMDYLFQSSLRLYFVMPFVNGGELYKIFLSKRRFTEQIVLFYAAQISLAIGYLHEAGIAHRDLKLENILVGEDGYLKIIDYGLAKMLGEDEVTTSFCGTPEYLAPEMANHQGHDKSVDWWAIGVLIYEMLIGVTPFYNKNRNMLLMKIKNSKVIFPDRTQYKIEYSDEIQDLIVKLLNKDRRKRLGQNGVNEVLSHPAFSKIDMRKLIKKEIPPPFTPDQSSLMDMKFFNKKTAPQDMTDTVIPQAK
jgi:serum/glucocorticoid-regulated kinase 2